MGKWHMKWMHFNVAIHFVVRWEGHQEDYQLIDDVLYDYYRFYFFSGLLTSSFIRYVVQSLYSINGSNRTIIWLLVPIGIVAVAIWHQNIAIIRTMLNCGHRNWFIFTVFNIVDIITIVPPLKSMANNREIVSTTKLLLVQLCISQHLFCTKNTCD